MGSLVGKVCGVGLMVFILSGCAAERGADGPTATAGAIEVAVSETCAAGSTPECVSVNGEHVVVAAPDFLRAEVDAVAVADDQPGNAVEVTLSSEGAAVLETSTSEVAKAGDGARLVITCSARSGSAAPGVEDMVDPPPSSASSEASASSLPLPALLAVVGVASVIVLANLLADPSAPPPVAIVTHRDRPDDLSAAGR